MLSSRSAKVAAIVVQDQRCSTQARPAAPIAARPRRVVEQAGDRVGDAPSGDRGSTTCPVSPSSTASGAPPESPATTGRPQAAASRKTMPSPSTSRPRAAGAAGHREHVAGRVVRRQLARAAPRR